MTAGTRPRSLTSMPCALAHSRTSVVLTPLAEALRQSHPDARWQQAVFVLGAERLTADVLDRISDAAELTDAGLLLGYRSIPPHVRTRLGSGHSAVAFMRLGNAADAPTIMLPQLEPWAKKLDVAIPQPRR